MGDPKSTASYRTTAEFTAGDFVGKLPTEAQQAQLAQPDRDPAARAQGYRLAETWSRRPGAPSITIDESRIGGPDKLAALLRQDLAHEIGNADQVSRDPVQYQHDLAEADKIKGTKAYPQTAAEQYASSYQKAALSELGISK